MGFTNRIVFGLFCSFFITSGFAVTYDWHIAEKNVNFTGKPVHALAINDQIPGPTIYAQEGDTLTVHVHNDMSFGTSIHWHGMLVPWNMDGVAGVTQPPIPPGSSFTYKFKLKQNGTYWYHAHHDFQEQQGLYGGIVIAPHTQKIQPSRQDAVLVFSDWSDTAAEIIFQHLKTTGDYYAPRMPMQASLQRFITEYLNDTQPARQELNSNYQMMQTMRMSLYDLSDVAYDAFLLNGHTSKQPWAMPVHSNQPIRLHLINASGSTLFKIKIPGIMLNIIQAQGNAIVPLQRESFNLAPGETVDVLLTLPEARTYWIYAESFDKVGSVIGALLPQGQTLTSLPTIAPFPAPQPLSMSDSMKDGSMAMMQMDGKNMPMNYMHHHKMISKPDTLYAALKPLQPNPELAIPAQTIHLTLSGYMGRYQWFLNGLPEYLAKPILIPSNQVVRIVMQNNSMMHHPMHIHGHWMILRQGQGRFDPKLHTIDVQPFTTITVDVLTDAEPGAWYFHCHNLYHMQAGMARLLQYDSSQAAAPYSAHHHGGGIHSANFIEFKHALNDTNGEFSWTGSWGTDFDKLQFKIKEAEFNHHKITALDTDIFYWHELSEFWAAKAGMNYVVRPHPYLRAGLGLEGKLPYFIQTDLRAYEYAGITQLDFEFTREVQLTDQFFLLLGWRGNWASQTDTDKEIRKGINNTQITVQPFTWLEPGLQVFAQWQKKRSFLPSNKKQNTVSVGMSAML
jgi:FtsP/CotA-like multicopper oxidase with cupredoxin domain